MSVGTQRNKRITKPIESEHLEELASQSVRASSEPDAPPPEASPAGSSVRMPRADDSGSRSTREMDNYELLCLLDIVDPTVTPPRPSPAAPWLASPRLVRTRSASHDLQTRHMRAKHFRALLRDGRARPLSPASLEAVDWYEVGHATTSPAVTAQRELDELLDQLSCRPSDVGLAEPVPGASGSSAEPPELVRLREARRARTRRERRAAIEMPPIIDPARPVWEDPAHAIEVPPIRDTTGPGWEDPAHAIEVPPIRDTTGPGWEDPAHAIEVPPIRDPAGPAWNDAAHAMPGTGHRSLPPARSAGPQLLISLIILAIAGVVLGLAIVESLAGLVDRA